jgi:hypothetical protein
MKGKELLFKRLIWQWLRRFLLLGALFVTSEVRSYSQIYYSPSYPYAPLFEYYIFYNGNLEIDPGASTPIDGSVFSNEGIWSGNANPDYSSYVEAAGQVTTTGTDPFLPPYTDAGTPAANFYLQPISDVAPVLFPGFGTNNLEAMLNLPPANVAAPQAIAYVPSNQIYTFNEASLIVSNWSNGTHATAPTGNNFAVYLQDPWSGPIWYAPSTGHWNQLTNDVYVVTNSTGTTIGTNTLIGLPGFNSSDFPASWSPTANLNITWTSGTSPNIITWGVEYAGWSFLTNVTFYDYRESKTVQALQIDISMLRAWITKSSITGGSNWNHALAYDSGSGINSIYVYNDVPMTSSQLPAVRVSDGLRLPNSTNVIGGWNIITSGLTVATPQPLYVWGNYNLQIDGDSLSAGYLPGTNKMAHTYPAALMADAITILSGTWRDLPIYNSATMLSSRNPSSTAITAACIEGNVPSSTNNPNTGGINGFSGGVESFLRFLENWSSSTSLTYNGSINVLFPSQYATNWWQQDGTYYNAPKRVWSFDTNFIYVSLLPPLTPTIISSNLPPSITAQPANNVVVVNQDTNLTVIASAVPAPNYQWKFKGTNIFDATNAVLELDDLQLTNAGNYTVQVTNVFGSVVSSNAVLTVYASAAAGVNGASFSAANGMEFSVAGVPGFNYAVEVSTNLVDWQMLFTNASPFSYLDTNALNLSQQFYRVVYLP